MEVVGVIGTERSNIGGNKEFYEELLALQKKHGKELCAILIITTEGIKPHLVIKRV